MTVKIVELKFNLTTRQELVFDSSAGPSCPSNLQQIKCRPATGGRNNEGLLSAMIQMDGKSVFLAVSNLDIPSSCVTQKINAQQIEVYLSLES